MEKTKARLVSLDVLRVLATLMIVCLHIELHGGVLEVSADTLSYGVMNRFIFAAAYGCVNLYVLISAYFLSTSDTLKVSKIFKLETQVLTYSIVLHLLSCLVGLIPFAALGRLLKAYMPTSHHDQYWFFTVYAGMYIFHPFINKALRAMNQEQHAMLVGLLIGLCIWNDLTPLNSLYLANSGFSLIWFLAVYIIGAYIRYYVTPEKVKKSIWLTVFLFATVLVTASWVVGHFVLGNVLDALSIKKDYFYRYDSTLLIVQSIALFMVFVGIKIRSKFIMKAAAFLSPLTFGIYLVHDNFNFKEFIWKRIFHTDTMAMN